MTGHAHRLGSALLLAALVLGGCRRDEDPVATGFQPLPSDVVMTGVTHYLTADGVRSAKLVSDSVYQHQDSSKVELFGVNLTLYDSSGQVTATVTSRFGDLDERTNAMVARGNVVVLRQDGAERIESEELHYNPQTHQIWSTVQTTRTMEGAVTIGDGFTVDDQFRNFQLQNARGAVPGAIRF